MRGEERPKETVDAEKQKQRERVAIVSGTLAGTPYECTSLEQVSGGFMNHTYRPKLAQALPDGSTTAIIKYSEEYVTSAGGIKYPPSRCLGEYRMLEALDNGLCSTVHHGGFVVRPPRPYHCFKTENVQIMEDLPDTTPLLALLLSPKANELSEEFASSMGHALGLWLNSFHEYETGRGPEVDKNVDARDRLRGFYYGRLEETIKQFPVLFEGVADKVKRYAKEEVEMEVDDGMTLAHGDFSIRNILVSEKPVQNGEEILLSPIDWEACHFGRRYQDLGQIMCELYIMLEVKGLKSSEVILRGLIAGYRSLNDEAVFHAAVYTGILIITWAFAIAAAAGSTPEQDEVLIGFARDLIIKGSEKDRTWLEGTVLGYLFQQRQ